MLISVSVADRKKLPSICKQSTLSTVSAESLPNSCCDWEGYFFLIKRDIQKYKAEFVSASIYSIIFALLSIEACEHYLMHINVFDCRF